MIDEFRCAPQRKRAMGRFYMSGMRLEIAQAADLLVDPLQGRRKHLFSLRWPFGGAGKTSAASFGLPAHLPLLLTRQRALLVSHLAQAQFGFAQLRAAEVVNGRVMRDADRLILVMAEQAAFEFAGDRHGPSSVGKKPG
ncbi:MAG: hypothetical protein JO008_00915 [Alphaproteobacteria bacterium]|nr:hypothetical protein [Alphaproteobacteria bacterium]